MGAGALRAAAGLIDALRARWADQPDERLLAAYAQDRDPHALAALVDRHGPAVWAVCRRLLRCPHDAEDAFQTTFLTLVRGAPALRANGTVGGWLYGVAVRTAAKSRAATRLRAQKERVVEPRADGGTDAAAADRDAVVAQEVGRLPDLYRDVVVLCDLQGRTRAEAARALGCPEGTVAGRLARGRAILARRFTRLGLRTGTAGLLVGLAADRAAAVPAAVVQQTLDAAAAVAPTGGLTAVMTGLLTSRRILTRAAVVLGVVTGGGAGVVYSVRPAVVPTDAVARAGPQVPPVSPPPAPPPPAAPIEHVTVGRVQVWKDEWSGVKFGFGVAEQVGGRADHGSEAVTVTVTDMTGVRFKP